MYKLFGTLVLVIALNCKASKNELQIKKTNTNTNMEKTNTTTTKTDFEPTLIAKGSLYGNGKEGINAQNLVITTNAEWQELIAKMDAVNKVSSSFSETDINFKEFIIVATFDKIQEASGKSLDISFEKSDNKIQAHITSKLSKGYVTWEINQPYCIVKIPVTSLDIVFNKL